MVVGEEEAVVVVVVVVVVGEEEGGKGGGWVRRAIEGSDAFCVGLPAIQSADGEV